MDRHPKGTKQLPQLKTEYISSYHRDQQHITTDSLYDISGAICD